MKYPTVYILSNQRNGTLYTGVTSSPIQRIWQHRTHLVPGFTHRHDVTRLVYFERHENMEEAILREKRIKKWRRQWKINLIERFNPQWADLWELLAEG
ncbi:GIY-YIG nuclease family protein [Marinobacteraceae bacterium S3BR75-40.1]